MNKLNVNSEPDSFDVLRHPEVFKEIKVLAYHVSKVPSSFQREILISFLKNHSINIDWLIGNDVLVQMITSGSLKMYHTERLFESRRTSKAFIADLEECIETELANCQYDAKHGNVLAAVSCIMSLEDQRYYPCASTLAADAKRPFGIHEEEVSNLTDRIKSKILNMMEVRKRMKRIFRSLSVRASA